MALPKVVAFDLDATLWVQEMYLLDGRTSRRGPRAKTQSRAERASERERGLWVAPGEKVHRARPSSVCRA